MELNATLCAFKVSSAGVEEAGMVVTDGYKSDAAKGGESSVGSKRSFEIVVENIEEDVHSGRLSIGTQLPTEREMAVRFGVSRSSVREAIRGLEMLGLVRIAGGTRNGVVFTDSPGDGLESLMRLYVTLGHVHVKDIREFLMLASGWAIQRSVNEGGQEITNGLRGIVDSMYERGVTQEAFESLDSSFHMLILRSCHTHLLTLLAESCRSTLSILISEAVQSTSDWPSLRRRLADEHSGILSAIEGNDVELASQLMVEHLDRWIP